MAIQYAGEVAFDNVQRRSNVSKIKYMDFDGNVEWQRIIGVSAVVQEPQTLNITNLKCWSIHDKQYSPGDVFVNTLSSTVVLARPEVIESRALIYDANGGTGQMPNTYAVNTKYLDKDLNVSYIYAPVLVDQCKFTYSDRYFSGYWQIDEEKVAVGTELQLKKDTIAYAIWIESVYITARSDDEAIGLARSDAVGNPGDTGYVIASLKPEQKVIGRFIGWNDNEDGWTKLTRKITIGNVSRLYTAQFTNIAEDFRVCESEAEFEQSKTSIPNVGTVYIIYPVTKDLTVQNVYQYSYGSWVLNGKNHSALDVLGYASITLNTVTNRHWYFDGASLVPLDPAVEPEPGSTNLITHNDEPFMTHENEEIAYQE